MKQAIYDALGSTFIAAGTLVILFAAGGSDAGDFTMGQALAQVGFGLVNILVGEAIKVLSRKEG